jgi:hypothetical protein
MCKGMSCGDALLLLDKFARSVFGYEGEDIVPAPPKTRLAFFYPGADALQIDDFREESSRSFTTCLSPPLLSSPEVYERHAVQRAQPWSVKGIRAKPPEREAAPASSSGNSLFKTFLINRRSSAQSSSADAPETGEGTLLDWRAH